MILYQKNLPFSVLFTVALCSWNMVSSATLDTQRTHPDHNPAFINPVKSPSSNSWPESWEQQYMLHAKRAIDVLGSGRLGGTTYGESEKDFYPRAMFHWLAGDRQAALKALQAEDAQARSDHQHTLGIDYYWCFTLKGQIRKYFYFGEYLDPAYRQRMYDAAKIWTELEPLRRPHPVHGKGDPNKGVWGPENKGSWVDVRDTDNLRAMRDTSVYLMAEESGNETTRLLYKQKIMGYVRMLYHVGMREWDSSNYHSHTLSPYHNLYDFAKDPEVKILAKAALDWLYAAGALKYYRGGFGGPRLRDYAGATVVFGGNAIHPLELYFGEAPIPDPQPDRDDLYQITSSYRPPETVVLLAKKQFVRPVEVLSSKPPYKYWEPGVEYHPLFHETLFMATTYQMGTMVSPNAEKAWNPSVFNFMAFNAARGVDFFAANTTPLWEHSEKLAGDQVAQYRNLVIWLRPFSPEKSFYFQIPKSAKMEIVEGMYFVGLEKTWLALLPVGLSSLTEVIPKISAKESRYQDERFYQASCVGNSFSGFMLEAGEGCSYEEFKKMVHDKKGFDASQCHNGKLSLTGIDRCCLQFVHNPTNDLPLIKRDGVSHDWSRHTPLYQSLHPNGPINLGWQQGTLTIRAGGRIFEQTVTTNGKVRFGER